MSRMLSTRSSQLPHKPFCLPTHPHLHQPPPQNLTHKEHRNVHKKCMNFSCDSMSSRHVESFSTIHIDLLPYMLVTFATSHRLRSPLKAEAEWNTVARKEGWLHSQSTGKKRRRKEEPWSKYSNSPKNTQTAHASTATTKVNSTNHHHPTCTNETTHRPTKHRVH